MNFARRAFLALLLICLGCSAQPTPSAPADVVRLLEHQVRSTYSVPSEVKVLVGPLRASDFPNYDALTITFDDSGKKKDYEFLLAKDRKTLLRMTKIDLTKDPYAELMKKIDVTGRPTRGAKDAKVVAVNFDDFQCPFCSHMHSNLFPTLLKEYGDRVLFIYKDYPLDEIHPWAIHAAVNANCLAAQNADAYWDFADYVHGNQKEINGEKGIENRYTELDKEATLQGQKHNLDASKLQACVKAQDDKAVRASQREGDNVGVSATPAMFVNGQKVDGAVPIEDLRAILDGALRDAGVAVPEHKADPAATK
ncbi:MAG: thioredoxin domain-containing protein [Acidobacteria bacterium]|nr:thioredoxin domain-containing protein [Acidobacteriota bacterium]